MDYSSKRIIKNTVALYTRSAFGLIINLFASRQLLKVLGVEDYGVYSVVGGLIILFGFLNSSMSASALRFLNYEMGANEFGGIQRVFSSILNIQILFSVIIFFLCQTVGLYFFYNFLNIPDARMNVAFWCMEFSILSLVISTIGVPYSTLLVAFENMNIFAYIDILGYVLNLFLVLFLEYVTIDRLFLYALVYFLIQLLLRVLYYIYCNINYSESKYLFLIDKALLRKILGFFSWTTLSGLSYLLIIQGIGILYNIFYGVLVSAAIGVANQVNGAVQNLCNNFTTSLFPQITKNYASGDYQKVKKLHFTGTKLSFVLLSIMAIPIIVDIEIILNIWLVTPPHYSGMFVILIMLSQLMTFFAITSNTVVRASGNIKKYEIVQNMIFFLFFGLLVIAFIINTPIYVPYLIYLLSALLISIYKAYCGCKTINVDFVEYAKSIYVRLTMFLILALSISYLCRPSNHNFIFFFAHVIFMLVIIVLLSWIIVFNKGEKKVMKSYSISFIKNRMKWIKEK